MNVVLAAAVQICHEFERFCTYLTGVKIGNFFGGIPMKQNLEELKAAVPSIVVGTPGRIKQVCVTPWQHCSTNLCCLFGS